jgi:quercetin 2,3-dioxygenase
MIPIRPIKKIIKSKPTLEGAGVHLNRVFGYHEVPQFDPFLLLDDFRSDDPKKYLQGFPWHPHRGIETITYVLEGAVEHGDSMGNKGIIENGDVQWMTAGSGIIHQEMPKGNSEGKMYGFQLWANLPASHKMMSPRYQEIKSKEIPELKLDGEVKIKVISGTFNGVTGPVKDIVISPEYLDISLADHTSYFHQTKDDHTVFVYVIGGRAYFSDDRKTPVENNSLVLLDKGDRVTIMTEHEPARLLLISGKPLGEPIAWGGPIVMNTQEELQKAFEEYHNGTFIKHSND